MPEPSRREVKIPVQLRGHESGDISSSASSLFKPAASAQELIHICDEQTGNDIIVYGV